MLTSSLLILGLVLQLLGALLAVLGLRKTWQQFVARDASLWEAVRREIGALLADSWDRVKRRTLRLLGRPSGRTVNLNATVVGTATMRATLTVGWPPLPKTAKAALPLLDQRMNELRRELDLLCGMFQEAKDDATSIEKRLAEAKQALEERDEKIAIGGIPMAVSGLFLVAVGVASQLLAEIAR